MLKVVFCLLLGNTSYAVVLCLHDRSGTKTGCVSDATRKNTRWIYFSSSHTRGGSDHSMESIIATPCNKNSRDSVI